MSLTVTVANTSGYATEVTAGRHTLVTDEPVTHGGTGQGMSPHALLLAALGGCTAITLRMYAERKGWPLEAVHVRLELADTDDGQQLTRHIEVRGALDQAQRARLAEIADRTPVTKMIGQGVSLTTHVG
ncbi:MAG: OsmC family protein [Actinomycetes bacterium]